MHKKIVSLLKWRSMFPNMKWWFLNWAVLISKIWCWLTEILFPKQKIECFCEAFVWMIYYGLIVLEILVIFTTVRNMKKKVKNLARKFIGERLVKFYIWSLDRRVWKPYIHVIPWIRNRYRKIRSFYFLFKLVFM